MWIIGSRLVGRIVASTRSASVLVVWAPPRKKRNQEQHALNGNTSAQPGDPGHWVKEAHQRCHRGSAVAWRSRRGPSSLA